MLKKETFPGLAQQVRATRMNATNQVKQKERDALPEMKMLLLEIRNLAGKALELPLCTAIVWGHLIDAGEHLEARIKSIEQGEDHV